ncbi:MAG TPA: ABC transporter substrate-binding protein [Acidimicrobiales bacterium]
MSISPVGNSGKGWNRSLTVLCVLGACVVLVAGACGSSSQSTSAGPAPVTLRLGYFPNITHAPALVGVQEGIFAKDLAPDTLDASKTFNAGPAETEAMLSGAIDVAFIGPSPSINAFSKSKGAVQIIAGATSGGAALVTKPSITSVDDLKGKTIATPQLANTQDVALRAFLKSKGFKTDTEGGGDVHVKPQDNSQTIDTFKQGLIDGAWVPEPYESQLVAAGGHVLVPESSLWPNGQWVTTNVLVRTAFLKAHPATITRFLTGLLDSVNQLKTNAAAAQAASNQQIQTLTGKKLSDSVLTAAFSDLSFTVDPLAATLKKQAADAVSVGLLTPTKLDGIYDLTLLNALLKSKGQPEVASS